MDSEGNSGLGPSFSKLHPQCFLGFLMFNFLEADVL